MMRLTGCAAALMLALSTSSTNALAPNKSLNIERRNFFGIVGSAGAAALLGASGPANAAALKTGLASPFTGDFDDPNHPGCLRQVKGTCDFSQK